MTTEQLSMADRVRSYIQHNAAKSPQEIAALVEKGHDQLFALIEGLSEGQASFKPSADEWSVLETMRHVVAGKRGVVHICRRLARGETPRNVGGEGQASAQDGVMGEEFATLAAARAAALAAHEELLTFVRGLSPETNVEARYPHFIFGELNCREWAVFQRVHDGDHAGQIEQIKAAPGFPRS